MTAWQIAELVIAMLSLAGSVYIVLLRFSLVTYEKNLEMRFAALEVASKDSRISHQDEAKEATAKFHALEVALTKMSGDVRLLERDHDRTSKALDEMITRDEWESRLKHLEGGLHSVQDMLRSILVEMRREQRDSSSNLEHAARGAPR